MTDQHLLSSEMVDILASILAYEAIFLALDITNVKQLQEFCIYMQELRTALRNQYQTDAEMLATNTSTLIQVKTTMILMDNLVEGLEDKIAELTTDGCEAFKASKQ